MEIAEKKAELAKTVEKKEQKETKVVGRKFSKFKFVLFCVLFCFCLCAVKSLLKLRGLFDLAIYFKLDFKKNYPVKFF